MDVRLEYIAESRSRSLSSIAVKDKCPLRIISTFLHVSNY